MTNFKLVVLGMAAAIRPTSLAAVAALAATTTPRRFLTAYVLAGLAFTVAIGVAAIWFFHGVESNSTSEPFRAFVAIAGGLAAMTFGLVLLSGRVKAPRSRGHQPGSAGRWTAALSDRVSIPRAAVAGPVTHLPGLLYLFAIDIIIGEQSSAPLGFVDLLIYNGFWFTVPIAALALSIIRPGLASHAVTAAQPWARKHGRSVVAIVCLTVGVALLVHGLLIR